MLSKSCMTSCLKGNLRPYTPLIFYLCFECILVSSVKLFVTLNSFQTTTLAVLYFVFSYENLHMLKSNICSYEAKILGSNLVFVHESRPSLGALLQP